MSFCRPAQAKRNRRFLPSPALLPDALRFIRPTSTNVQFHAAQSILTDRKPLYSRPLISNATTLPVNKPSTCSRVSLNSNEPKFSPNCERASAVSSIITTRSSHLSEPAESVLPQLVFIITTLLPVHLYHLPSVHPPQSCKTVLYPPVASPLHHAHKTFQFRDPNPPLSSEGSRN